MWEKNPENVKRLQVDPNRISGQVQLIENSGE
jgi:hypothetical protein